MPHDRLDLAQGPPPVPLALVEYLEALWPDKFPALTGPDLNAALHTQAGRIEVIRFLRQHAERTGAQRSPRQPTRTESPF